MKKAKRFQSGNLVTQGYTGGPRVSYDPEAEKLKKEGLEASKDDRVGFFKRLAMGNIDDPRSEAHKRYGAGRGTAERAKVLPPAPAIRSTDSGMGVPGLGAPMMPKEPEAPMPVPAAPEKQIGLRSALTPQGVGEGGKAPEVVERETTTVKTPRKTVTQTKKAVAKPTYSEKEAAPKAPPSPKTSKEEGISAPGGKFIEKNVRTFKGTTRPDASNEIFNLLKKKNKERLAKIAENKAASGSTVGKMPGPSLSSDPYSMTLGSDLDPKAMMRRNARLSGDGDFKKGGKIKDVKKYASGGMVGKASKRADGIAKKGKTKGRII